MQQPAKLWSRKRPLGSNPSLSAKKCCIKFGKWRRWQRIWFGTRGSQVRVLSSRQSHNRILRGPVRLKQLRTILLRGFVRTRSSAGQSICLLSRRSQVRILPGSREKNKTSVLTGVLSFLESNILQSYCLFEMVFSEEIIFNF